MKLSRGLIRGFLFLTLILQMGAVSGAWADDRVGATKVLDLAKNFVDAQFNIYGDRTYVDDAIVVTVPAPANPGDEYLVSIVEDNHAACLVSGIRVRTTDAGPIFYARVYIQSIETNNGRCHIGLHLHSSKDNTTRSAFLDFTSSNGV